LSTLIFPYVKKIVNSLKFRDTNYLSANDKFHGYLLHIYLLQTMSVSLFPSLQGARDTALPFLYMSPFQQPSLNTYLHDYIIV